MNKPVFLACGMLGFLAAGCSSSETPNAATQTPALQKKPAAQVSEPAAPAVADMFSYSPVGRRDPFRSYLSELAEQSTSAHPERTLEATEHFEIDQYHLTGLITGISQPKAMVEDPDGLGHVVQIGTRIGKNSGVITQIGASGILIVEETHDAMGKKVRLPVTLKLPQTEFEDIANR
jgi:type IV pilus assembly protein PilP